MTHRETYIPVPTPWMVKGIIICSTITVLGGIVLAVTR